MDELSDQRVKCQVQQEKIQNLERKIQITTSNNITNKTQKLQTEQTNSNIQQRNIQQHPLQTIIQNHQVTMFGAWWWWDKRYMKQF